MNESELMKELETFVGKSGGPSRRSAYPIGDAMIHHWCDAIGDRNASYLDPEFAKSGVHGGIVAPPTMLQAWTMAGFRSESVGADDGERTSKTALDVLDDAGFTSVVATNCEQEYCRYLTPGDQIRHDVEIESVSAEKKTGLGVGHFVSQLYTYRDAADEIVGPSALVSTGSPAAQINGEIELESRVATINTFGGVVNEIQREIVSMAGLRMPRVPR